MTSSGDELLKTLRDQEKERLARLPGIDRDPDHTEDGVLLSHWIEHYCEDSRRMIDPFDPEYLRPAGYDLRVGNNYTKKGEPHTLNKGGSLTIDPYQVAIIQTLETLNMPEFLIGRWNIRVGLAYDGLLWVGGAQVDPGFQGYLSCPIYNLATEEVTLKHGQKLAMIDFVTTTSVRHDSKRFKLKKYIFQDYNTKLQSGVAQQLDGQNKKIEENRQLSEKKAHEINETLRQNSAETRTRIDGFVALVFTVVAVLFAGLGIVATRGSEGPSFWNSTVWVSAVALYFALRAHSAASREDGKHSGRLEYVVVGIIAASILCYQIWHFNANKLGDASAQASSAMTAIEQQQRDLEGANARIEILQQQVDALRQGAANRQE